MISNNLKEIHHFCDWLAIVIIDWDYVVNEKLYSRAVIWCIFRNKQYTINFNLKIIVLLLQSYGDLVYKDITYTT